jgi:hypothetical protein
MDVREYAKLLSATPRKGTQEYKWPDRPPFMAKDWTEEGVAADSSAAMGLISQYPRLAAMPTEVVDQLPHNRAAQFNINQHNLQFLRADMADPSRWKALNHEMAHTDRFDKTMDGVVPVQSKAGDAGYAATSPDENTAEMFAKSMRDKYLNAAPPRTGIGDVLGWSAGMERMNGR